MNFAKCNIKFLRHIVSHDGTQSNPKKIKSIIDFPIPTIVTNVQVFLGLTWYYINYVKGYSCIAIPLFDLTKSKGVIFKWSPNC